MSDLYLIAHKVRGEPAFDIAERMECPECNGNCADGRDPNGYTCVECECLGYWWIIGTSGHRAYPYFDWALNAIELNGYPEISLEEYLLSDRIEPMPSTLPDHYHHTASPATVRARLEDLLSALPPTPTTPFKRRF